MNDEPIKVKTRVVYQNLRPHARGHFDFSKKILQTENPPLRSHGDFGIIFAVFTPRSGGEIGRHACLRCMWSDPCGFESRPEHHVVGYSSGQRGQTVNLLACAFGGSNPPPTTIPQSPFIHACRRSVYLSRLLLYEKLTTIQLPSTLARSISSPFSFLSLPLTN